MPASDHRSSKAGKLSDAPDVKPTETIEEPHDSYRLAQATTGKGVKPLT